MNAIAAAAPEIAERAHHRGGIRRILELAWVYAAFRSVLWPANSQRTFVAECIPAASGSRILDIGCGTGSILDYLPRVIDYTGYDLNPKYITRAQQRHGKRGRFHCADITAQSAPQIASDGFDIILAIALVHHLNDAEAHTLCMSAFAQLRPGGVFIAFDPVYAHGQSPIARYIISRDRGRAVRSAAGYRALAEPIFDRVEHQIRTDLLRIPYTHFIMHCRKD